MLKIPQYRDQDNNLFDNVYVCIISFYTNTKDKTYLKTGIFMSEDDVDNGAEPFETRTYTPSYEAGITEAMLYEFLKSKPEFSGATEV